MKRAEPAAEPREFVSGFIERVDDTSLEGWVFASRGTLLRFTLRADGEDVCFHLQRRPRADVSAAHPAADLHCGFRLSIVYRGASWRDAAARGTLLLDANGHAVSLSDCLFRELAGTASEPCGPGDLPAEPSAASSHLDHTTVRHWQALRRVNQCIADGGLLAESARRVCDEEDLDGPARDRLFQSLCPRLCANGDRAALWSLGHPSRLIPARGLRGVRNAWIAGLALVGFCETGQVLPAIGALHRIAGLLDTDDWLPTECLHHAMRRMAIGARDGRVAPARMRLFVHALLRVCRAQEGRWYSRLFDRELISALICALRYVLQADDEQLRAVVISSAIRVYGLCPVFWELAAPLAGPHHPLLWQALANWQCIEHALREAEKGTAEKGTDLFWVQNKSVPFSALDWFHARRNADAAQYRRELTAQGHLFGLESSEPVLWPSYPQPVDGPRRGAIERVGGCPIPPSGLLLICVVRDEQLLLPHFLAHYRGLGVGHFVFVDNGSTDGTRELLLAQPDATVFSAADHYRDAAYGVAWQQAVLANFCLGRWVLLAGADEFLVYDGCAERSLGQFVGEAEAAGADAVFTDLVDMYPGAALADADLQRLTPFEAAPFFDREPLRRWHLGGGRFSSAPCYVSALRHRLVPDAEPNAFQSQKCALFRYQPWLRLGHGIHDVANARPHAGRAWFAHFKYHAAFAQKVEEEVRRGQHYAGAREYLHYAEILEDAGGFWLDGISLRYAGSGSFRGVAAEEAACGAEGPARPPAGAWPGP